MSIEETAAALATTNLSTAEQIKILRLKGATAETAAAMVETYGYAASEVTATTGATGLTAATTGLTTALHGLKAAFASNPIGFIITAAVMAITVIVSLVSKIKSASERLEESANEVKELKDKISGLNDDLNTTKKRIDELSRKGTLTIVEQAELNRLRKVNAELERQIALEEARLATAKGKNERDFVDSVNGYLNKDNPLMAAGHISNENLFGTQLSLYLNPDSTDAVKEQAKKWMDEFIPEFSGYMDKLVDYDYSTLSDDAKAAYDKVMDIQNAYLVATSENFDTVFKSIFNSDRFAEGREALENAAKDGLTATEVEGLYNSNDDVKAMVDNMKNVGLITDTTSDSFKGLAAQIEEADQVVGSIASDTKVAFSDLISNENVQETINGFKTKLSELSDALEDYRNGNLSDSDLIELFEKFPELANRTDDLDVALEELIDSTQTEIDNQFESWEKNMPTDEDADSLNAVKNSLDGIANEAKGIKSLSGEIDKLNESLDDLQSTYSDIQDIQKNFNENGYYSTDDLQKLLELEPEYLNLLIDENGQINLNSQAYKNYMAAKAKSLLLDQITSLYESILNMSIEEAQAYATASAYDEESNSVENLTKHYLELAKAKDIANNTTVYTAAMEQSFGTVANYMAIYDSWLNSLNSSTNEFTNQTNSATSALEDEKDALEDAKDALEDYKDALSDAQSDIQDLIDLVIEYIKQLKQDEMDALEDQIDALEEQKDNYDDIISKKKEALELAKNEREEAETLADLQKSVAKDALALAVANLDDSSAGKKAQKQAQDSLLDSNRKLQDELYNQEYDMRVAALEKEQEAYDERIDKRIATLNKEKDAIQDYLDDVRQLYEDACNMIDNDTGDLYNKLWNDYVYPYTTKTRAEFDNLWSSAQTAIQKYKGDNDTLIGTMEYLQSEIYITEQDIGDIQTAIDNTNEAIDGTSTAIDAVSTSLSGLGGTIADYMSQLSDLVATANNLDLSNTGGEKTAFWVYHNGRKYETGYNYNGDTEGNRLLAAAELTKLIARDVSGFDNYGLGIVQGYLGVGTTGAQQWYYTFHGKTYTWTTKNQDTAIAQIASQVKKDYGGRMPAGAAVNKWTVQHYATGTYGSKGGLSITQEKGLESIFGKLSNGQYTLMNEGSHVFSAEATENLHKFMDNPTEFMSQHTQGYDYSGWLKTNYGNYDSAIKSISENVSNTTGDTSISAPVTITIQGDATQSTVNAIKKESDKIKNAIINDITRVREKQRRATIR